MTTILTPPGRVFFFSLEFFQKLIESLNMDESLAKVTKGMNTTLLISCDEANNAYLISTREGRLSVEETSKNSVAEFVFHAPYREWEKIAKGEMKMPSEVVSGKVKFKGSMPKMLLYLNKVLGLEKKIMKSINSMTLTFKFPNQ
ncbi:MAG: SCP2 sterol-binding domain-containing protein [Thaumarchaeota archaeon]|nr:SCP2 sterol-binding domain-containing protein [Nitrososphaerota archaeon]